MGFVLLYSCLATPVELALFEETMGTFQVLNYIADAFFFVDIFVCFNSMIYNEDFEIISDRATIVKTYLKGWFLIDLIAIFPFSLIFGASGGAAKLVRFVRIGRITKLLKLFKLARLMKLQKKASFSILNWLIDQLSISQEMRWFFNFFCYFIMIMHVVGCFWIMLPLYDPN